MKEAPAATTAFAALQMIQVEQLDFMSCNKQTTKQPFDPKFVKFGNFHKMSKSDSHKRVINACEDAGCDIDGTKHDNRDTDDKK